MLGTDAKEGGLDRTSPKTTPLQRKNHLPPGDNNGCFVRPVAVAGIFKPALADTENLSKKQDVPEKRRFSVLVGDLQPCGETTKTPVSSEEFARRRQSWDTRSIVTVPPFGQNLLRKTPKKDSGPSKPIKEDDSSVAHHSNDLESHLSTDKKSVTAVNGECNGHCDFDATDDQKISKTVVKEKNVNSFAQNCIENTEKCSSPVNAPSRRQRPKNPDTSVEDETTERTISPFRRRSRLHRDNHDTDVQQFSLQEDRSKTTTVNVGVTATECKTTTTTNGRTVAVNNDVKNLSSESRSSNQSININSSLSDDKPKLRVYGVNKTKSVENNTQNTVRVAERESVTSVQENKKQETISTYSSQKASESSKTSNKVYGLIKRDNKIDSKTGIENNASENTKATSVIKNDVVIPNETAGATNKADDKITQQSTGSLLENKSARNISQNKQESSVILRDKSANLSDSKAVDLPKSVRTARRTSDVIAAKIHSIFSNIGGDKTVSNVSTLSSKSDLNSSRKSVSITSAKPEPVNKDLKETATSTFDSKPTVIDKNLADKPALTKKELTDKSTSFKKEPSDKTVQLTSEINENFSKSTAQKKELDSKQTALRKELDSKQTSLRKELDNKQILVKKELDNKQVSVKTELDNKQILVKKELDNKQVSGKTELDNKQILVKKENYNKQVSVKTELDNKQIVKKGLSDKQVSVKTELDNKQILVKKELDNKQVSVKTELDNKQILVKKELDNKQTSIKKELEIKQVLLKTELDNKQTSGKKEFDNKHPVVKKELDNKIPLVKKELDNKPPLVKKELDNKPPLVKKELDNKEALVENQFSDKYKIDTKESIDKPVQKITNVKEKDNKTVPLKRETDNKFTASEKELNNQVPLITKGSVVKPFQKQIEGKENLKSTVKESTLRLSNEQVTSRPPGKELAPKSFSTEQTSKIEQNPSPNLLTKPSDVKLSPKLSKKDITPYQLPVDKLNQGVKSNLSEKESLSKVVTQPPATKTSEKAGISTKQETIDASSLVNNKKVVMPTVKTAAGDIAISDIGPKNLSSTVVKTDITGKSVNLSLGTSKTANIMSSKLDLKNTALLSSVKNAEEIKNSSQMTTNYCKSSADKDIENRVSVSEKQLSAIKPPIVPLSDKSRPVGVTSSQNISSEEKSKVAVITSTEPNKAIPATGKLLKTERDVLTNVVSVRPKNISEFNSVNRSPSLRTSENDLFKSAYRDLSCSKSPPLSSHKFDSVTTSLCNLSYPLSSTVLNQDDLMNGSLSSTESLVSESKAPRPPERKRLSLLKESSAVPSYTPTVTRTASLRRFDDSKMPTVMRSPSHSTLPPSYNPHRYSYTEMLSKVCSYGITPSASTTFTPPFKKYTGNSLSSSLSQVSELWSDLSQEQTSAAHTSEMLESETTERMRLEKEVTELQSRYSHVQQKSDKMEMEMMEARVYRSSELNGDLSEDEDGDANSSIYKQKYEKAVQDMEIMKRRIQQQREEETEQALLVKKAADKKLAEALEDVEEERQVASQWKRKAQKLGSELQDLRLMLEEQMARNGELEKKQRRFDAELSACQEEIKKEHSLREKMLRERDQALHEKYSLEQELHSTQMDMDKQLEKITLLNRELDELSLSSKGEEEVTQLKRAKQELERKCRDQEEELEEYVGQVQMLEQAKLRLEMTLEKLRQEHRRESSVREEEIEELRASFSKKIKNLEAQLEAEQEDRHQLVKQKHELERRVIELTDQPPPVDPEIERRLRRDLKRTKALLRDAQAMLEHVRDGQGNKSVIRQLKNQLEDAEFSKCSAIKAKQTAEMELQDLQTQLEEVTRNKNDHESRCLQLSREKSALQTQLEEIEEEMAEVMKKYKASVAQMSIDQKTMAEQNQQIAELEAEKNALREQLSEVNTKFEHLAGQTDDSHRAFRLDAKVRDLESKLELEQTSRARVEHQVTRLKEQIDRLQEECDSLRNKELQAQEGIRRFQRQVRDLREDYAGLQQKESDAYRKQHELETALENAEADLKVTKNDLRLACQRIEELKNALEDDLDSGTDVPDDSGSDSDSSLDMSSMIRPSFTPIQRCDSAASDLSYGSRRSVTPSYNDMAALCSRGNVETDINGFSHIEQSKFSPVSSPGQDLEV